MFKSKAGKKIALLATLLSVLVLVIGIGAQHRCAAQGNSDYESIELFTDVMKIVQKNYVEEVDSKKLVYGAINGMLSSLDPHSSFMPPEMYKEMKIDTKGSFGGLGIEITIKDGFLTVISPIEDTPAFKAGIKSGDQILKIEGKFTKDMTIIDAVKKMRGPKGSKINITIMREGFDKPREVNLTRDIVQIKSVKFKTLDAGFGYVRIAQFQEKTDEDLSKALKTLKEDNKGALKGLVLDLRNDPGGLLDQAVKVCDHFVDNGLIVYTEGRDPESKMKFLAKKGNKEPLYPIVVLINGGSASASEIVAGALQDHNRAVIMGTQSFGKGSVQTIIPLTEDSGLRLTTALYYTPKGRSIQAKGIVPDITVEALELATVEKKNTLHIREKDLENHFETEPKDSKVEQTKPTKPVVKLDEPMRGDYQLLRALDLLRGWDILKKTNKTG
ncbi:MAG: S41 family peptidase [Deltaproteobacteria bacterium]